MTDVDIVGAHVALTGCGSVFDGTVIAERVKHDDTGREVLIRHAYGEPFWTDRSNVIAHRRD